MRTALGLPDEVVLFGTVGRLNEAKQQGRLLVALRTLLDTGVPAALFMALRPPPIPNLALRRPAPAQPAATAVPNFPFLLQNTETCSPNEGTTYFSGVVKYANGSLQNGVCVHIAFYGPRNTCLLYTSDAADERSSVDLGGRRTIKQKKKKQ